MMRPFLHSSRPQHNGVPEHDSRLTIDPVDLSAVIFISVCLFLVSFEPFAKQISGGKLDFFFFCRPSSTVFPLCVCHFFCHGFHSLFANGTCGLARLLALSRCSEQPKKNIGCGDHTSDLFS